MMNKEQAFHVLTQALNAANKAGVYNLQDSAYIAQSLFVVEKLLDIKRSEPQGELDTAETETPVAVKQSKKVKV
jgi:hypothetical protein